LLDGEQMTRKGFGIAGLVIVAHLFSACAGEGAQEPGTLAVGTGCRSTLDCAQEADEPVECRCTDQAREPICDRLSGPDESCAITGSFQKKCREGLTCAVPPGGDPLEPVCLRSALVGAYCTSFADCVPDLVCDTTSQQCRTGAATLGQDCFNDIDCAVPLRCAGFTCAAPIETGESCATAGVPTLRTCEAGSACGGWSQRCEKLKNDGERCGWDLECLSGVCFFDTCGKDARIVGSVQCG
jgi:hypothetical protein